MCYPSVLLYLSYRIMWLGSRGNRCMYVHMLVRNHPKMYGCTYIHVLDVRVHAYTDTYTYYRHTYTSIHVCVLCVHALYTYVSRGFILIRQQIMPPTDSITNLRLQTNVNKLTYNVYYYYYTDYRYTIV